MRTIDIEKLQIIFGKLINKLVQEDVKEIRIEDDLYNKIPTHKWNIYNKPNEVVVIGSINDDIDSLEKLISDENRMCAYVDFDRFASLLRIISEIQNPVD